MITKKIKEFYNYEVPGYVIGGNMEVLYLRVGDELFGEEEICVTIDDVCRFYAFEAPRFSSIKTLSGHSGDHRPISNLADECLQYFKFANMKGLKRELKQYEDIMEPKF